MCILIIYLRNVIFVRVSVLCRLWGVLGWRVVLIGVVVGVVMAVVVVGQMEAILLDRPATKRLLR